jgi:hypothetical protein
MAPVLDEQSRRRFVALEAQTVGHGGVSLMSEISAWHGPRFIADCRIRTAVWTGVTRDTMPSADSCTAQNIGVAPSAWSRS